MHAPRDLVFLFDVDNTLLDNDRFQHDLFGRVEQEFGAENGQRYHAIFEDLRTKLGYVDYLGAMQELRLELMDHPAALSMSAFLLDYPFADLVYPGAFAALSHLAAFGQTVILSDGDAIFQPHKIQRAGLWRAVDGRVLVYVHKERMLADVEACYPARHYVMVDDKLSILSAMKQAWGPRLTTVFPRQGHYALDTKNLVAFAAADITVEHIADLATLNFSAQGDLI
jgi:FMN phosphatase YigB (HAD superfamily)